MAPPVGRTALDRASFALPLNEAADIARHLRDEKTHRDVSERECEKKHQRDDDKGQLRP